MDGLLANLLLSILLTAVAYMAFPLIRLAINHGKFEKKRAKKIALWNSIVVGAFFCIVTIGASDGGITWNAAPAMLYFLINRALLTDKEAPKGNAIPVTAATPAASKITAAATPPVVTHSLSSTNDTPTAPAKNDIYGNEFRVAKHTTPQTPTSASATVVKPILFCRKCGNKLVESSVFCNKCGIKVLFDDSGK